MIAHKEATLFLKHRLRENLRVILFLLPDAEGDPKRDDQRQQRRDTR